MEDWFTRYYYEILHALDELFTYVGPSGFGYKEFSQRVEYHTKQKAT